MIKKITTQTLFDWYSIKKKMIVLDTLPAISYLKGHLPNAINIVSDDIILEAPRLLDDKYIPIVVYCANSRCKRAGLYADRLIKLGYSEVLHYEEGKAGWVQAGYELEQMENK